MAAIEAQLVDPLELPAIVDYEFLGDNDTVVRKRAFIEAYREQGSIFHAAIAIRVSRKTVYRWIDNDEQFAQAVEESKEDCVDQAETSVFKKALAGDSLLLMFYLKAHRPKFRDRVTVDLDVVKNEIEERMNQLRQLPANLPVNLPIESLQTQQFSPQPEDLQKESGE